MSKCQLIFKLYFGFSFDFLFQNFIYKAKIQNELIKKVWQGGVVGKNNLTINVININDKFNQYCVVN